MQNVSIKIIKNEKRNRYTRTNELSALLSRACFWFPLRCIFIGNGFRFIRLCLFAYFSLNSCVGLSYISIFPHFGIRLAFVLYYSVFDLSVSASVWYIISDFLDLFGFASIFKYVCGILLIFLFHIIASW